MASDSDTSSPIEIPINRKLKRRSSIFRPNDAEFTVCNADEIFPPNYSNQLLQETLKWSEAYTNIKTEYLEWKKKAHNAVQLPTLNLTDYQTYLRKAEDFCCQVSNIVEFHETAMNYHNNRREELQQEIRTTSRTMRKKLNV